MRDLGATTDRAGAAPLNRRALLLAAAAAGLAPLAVPQGAVAAAGPFTFASIDGGTLSTADWAGRPVLVVNTASRCAFTRQYEGLQALSERYRDRGLVVLAVPSNDFRQELDSEEAVKEFCELTFGLDLPMTEITRVRGRDAHPFYRWLAEAHGIRPLWNFHKVLLDGAGRPVANYASHIRPAAPVLTDRIEALLGAS